MMRKILSVLILVLVMVMALTACDSKTEKPGPEQQVTMEQVNSEGKYVARAFIESIFTDNKAMFDKCYPDGFFDRMGETSGDDLYGQYRNVMKINANVNGTASSGVFLC